MRKLQGLAAISVAVLQSACLSTLLGSGDKKSDSYFFPKPEQGWEKIDPAEADAAYRNRADKAILNVTSTCGEERFRSLEDLSADVLKQLPEHELIGPQKPTNIDGHPALITDARGQVDGHEINVRLAIVRTDTCIYDFMLAGPQFDASSRVAFDKAIEGFRDGAK